MALNQPLLSVTDLHVEIEGQTIFSDLSFSLNENERLVILGPNGAGKSVLLKAITGTMPFSGEIAWRKDVVLGYVPQRVPMKRDTPITVADFFHLKGVSESRALSLLNSVGLAEGKFHTQLGVLSSGQFQRVLIAFAMAKNPNVLILDEAMTGVDISGEDLIHSFLHRAELSSKTAVILVTHDLSAVYGETTKVLCLNRERHFILSPSEVLDPKMLQETYGHELRYIRHNHA